MFNEKNLNDLYRYALSLTHNEEWAYDLVSHGVEKVLERLFVVNKIGYSKRCIRNKFFDERKVRARISEEVNVEEFSFSNFEEMMINKNEVEEVLGEISEQERELLYLWAVEEYSLSEISKLTGEPRGTLTSRLFRLKKKLVEATDE